MGKARATFRSAEGLVEILHPEFEQVLECLDTAAAGAGGAILVAGEAGSGKSELLSGAVEVAHERGWFVLHLRPEEVTRAVPYGALANAVSLLRGTASPEVDQLASELTQVLDLAAKQPLAAVHGATARLFGGLRGRAPALLIVDDLPDLDDDTVVLVASMLRRAAKYPIVLAGAIRKPGAPPVGALEGMLTSLMRDGLVTTVGIGPLPREAVTELVAAMLDRRPDENLIEFVQDLSGGNPFFVEQSVRELVDSGGLECDESGCHLIAAPPKVSGDRGAAVLQRILRVDRETHRLAQALALLGSADLDRLGLAGELASLSPVQAEAAFDALIENGVLRVGDDRSYRFCYQLVRNALYEEILPARRRRWHTIAVGRLSSLPSSPAVHLEIAGHVREIAEFGNEADIRLLTTAAEITIRAAPHSSVPWYLRALEVTPPSWPLHGELTERLTRALFLAGRPAEAAAVGEAALSRHKDEGNRERLALLVIESLVETMEVQRAAELMEIERRATPRSLKLNAKAAYMLALCGRQSEAESAAQEVLGQLDEASNDDRVSALVHLTYMRGLEPGSPSLFQLCNDLHEAASEAPLAPRLNAYAATSWVLAVQGETAACAKSIERARQLLAESGWSLYRAELAVAEALNASNLGLWDTALSVTRATTGELEVVGSTGYLTMLRDIEADVLANRGEWPAARRAAGHDFPAHPSYAGSQVLALAEIELLSGDLTAARRRLEQHLSDHNRARLIHLGLLVRLAETEAEAGNPDAAKRILSEIYQYEAPDIDRVTFVRSRLCFGRATGDVAALLEAEAMAEEHGLALLRGRSRLYLGAAGVDTEENLREAVRIFHSLGATPWRRRAAGELQRRGFQVPRHRAAPAPNFLTDTESQIARLVQLGRTNPEIAAAMFLSKKTVEAYLTRIYEKTGISNRLELARALDKGLLG